MGIHHVPPGDNKPYEAQEPIGKDIVIALLSKSKLNLGEKEDYTWDEIFERLRSSKFFEYVKTRGQGVAGAKPLGQTDWQVVSLVLETIE
jgi:translation initiation factor RLI1